MKGPKKLIRSGIIKHLKENEYEIIEDQEELNKLYALKIQEELVEVQKSNYKGINEFVDLIQCVFEFAKMNGFDQKQLSNAILIKSADKGMFGKLVLTNLNPNNPSNKIYFDKYEEDKHNKDS